MTTRPRHALSRRRLLAAAPAALASNLVPALGLAPLAAQAQAFPDRTVRLVVGFPPGTGPDVVARLMAAKLSELLRQQVVVDNRAGAGGQIAAQQVAKSPADGYTLLLGEVGSISIAPPAFSKLAYDPAKELSGISEVVRSDFLLVVPTNSPHANLADFLKAAKAKGDKVNFATFGAGTPAAVLDQLNRQIVASMADPTTKGKLVDAGFSVSGTSRADTERLLKAEAQRWAGIVKASGFKGD